jgi:hypothetical protein
MRGAAPMRPGHWAQIVSLAAGLAALCAVFVLAAWALRAPELPEFLRALRRKKGRAAIADEAQAM